MGVWTPEQHDMSENRETTNADMYQALPRLAGYIASGRAEETSSFSQTCCTLCNMFVKKKKKVPCCRRRIRLPSGETSGLDLNHVSSVIQACIEDGNAYFYNQE